MMKGAVFGEFSFWGFTCPAQKWKVWRMHVKNDVAEQWRTNRNPIVLLQAGSLGSSTRMEKEFCHFLHETVKSSDEV